MLKLKFGAIRGVVRGMVIFGVIFLCKIRHQIVSLMSCGRVISYVYVSLCYVFLQVNKIRSMFQIWVGDRCEMFGLMMRVMGLLFGDVWIGYVNFDGFGEKVIFG